MHALIPEDVTPIKLAHIAIKVSGAANQSGRPWSLLLPCGYVIFLNYFGFSAVMEIFFGNGSLTEFVQTISAITVYIHVGSKNVNLLMNEAGIRDLLKRIEKLRKEISTDDVTTHLIKKDEDFAKKCIILFATMFIGFPIFSLINNFVIDYLSDFEKPHLTHQIWLPWSMKEFWPYLAGASFITMLTLSAVTCYTSYGTLQLAFTFELSAFIKTLQYRLQTKGAKDTSIYQHHQAVIKLLHDYNKLFSGQLYMEILVSSLQPCGFGYAFIKVLKRYDPGAPDLAYKFLICVFAPFFICSCGQELNTQMEKLHEYSYMNNWYEEKPAVRKDLLTMMIVTVKPIEMNYRRMISFNYVCFARVAQGIYSYLAMIVNLESD